MKEIQDDFIIFAGSANRRLAEKIAAELGVRLGDCRIERFPDGELFVRLGESVRRREVFIVQPTQPPVNENLMELLVFSDACRRASATRITAIVPYFGYARADKRHGHREPITASMVADLFQTVGIDHVITVDVHASQIEGFFRVPFDNLTAVCAFAEILRERLPENTVVVSPDAGRVRMATEFAHRLKTSVIVLHKQRESGTETTVTHLVGDARGRACLIVDDMISTGGTIAESIDALLAAGAKPNITIAATHGLLLGSAREKLEHESVKEIFITDTVETEEKNREKLRVVSVAPLIAETIRRFLASGSSSNRKYQRAKGG
jgi:ribose-phosphate pyrophosphokinase